MFSQLNIGLVQARQAEQLERASGRRRGRAGVQSAPRWEALTMRLATCADRAALQRLADLEQTSTLADPVLLGVLMQRPVAALSLADGRLVADPFTRTSELVELMRVRAGQLRRSVA